MSVHGIESTTRERHVPESEMVETGFALRNRRIGDLMLPRTAVAWLDADRPVEEQRQTIVAADQEAFPVCRGSLDHVLGVIGPRDVRSACLDGGRLDLTGRLGEPLRLPRTLRLLPGLDDMRRSGTELALVVDEDGLVVGAVTARGLLEVLATEVLSGIRPVRPESVPRPDGSWLLDGMLPIAELRALFRLDDAADRAAHPYRTLAGLVLARLDRLPSTGDAFEWQGLRIEVLDLDGRRIDKLLVAPLGT